MTTRYATIVLASLLGCSDADDPVEPVPYIVDEVDVPAPAATTDELSAWITEAIAVAWTVDPAPVLEAYAEVTASRDEYCPYFIGDDVQAQWYGECESYDGGAFQGYGGHDYYEGDDGWQEVVYTSGTIETPDGFLFEGGGSAYRGGTADEFGTTTAYAGIQGSFAYDGPAAEGTWLADGTDVALQRVFQAGQFGQFHMLEGAVTLEGRSVALSQVLFFGLACAIEPGGMISVRGDDGWYDVLFDTDFQAIDPAACDGCGEAYYRGEYVGPVCIDVSDYTIQETQPW
jgi:hypothetical protein